MGLLGLMTIPKELVGAAKGRVTWIKSPVVDIVPVPVVSWIDPPSWLPARVTAPPVPTAVVVPRTAVGVARFPFIYPLLVKPTKVGVDVVAIA